MGVAERSHLMEYSVVALLIHEALTERASHGRRVPVPALLAVLATVLIGVLDECIQAFVPSRVFDPLDMVQNAVAAVTAVAASVALHWARRRVVRSSRSGE
jgi:VanZ family protein